MRTFSFRRPLLPLCAALILPTAACGDDSTPAGDTSDTTVDTTDTTQPDTTDTTQPDTTDTTQPDTTDTTDTTEPDTTDTTEPDTTDTTEPDTTDTTEPETTDTTEPDTTDTTEPETTTDTAGDTTTDTTPTTLATLLAPFATSANNFETAPAANVVGLVVTLVKPDFGTELGGFFAIDPSDDTPVFFAPAAGATGAPVAGSTISVKIDTIKNVAGVPMVTAFSDLSVTSTGADLDALAVDISAWPEAEYAGSQSTYFDLAGEISGVSAAAGGGTEGFRRFGFTSTGLTAVSTAVQVRFPATIVNTLAIEDGCLFTITGGGVWGFRGSAADATVQYQPMVVDSANLTVLCDAPKLLGATTDGNTSVVLTFSRPLLAATVEAAAFTFEPALTVNTVALSADGKTVTLTTAEHTASSYVVSVDESVTDVLGEAIDTTADTFTFDTGNVAGEVIVGWNFGAASPGTLTATSGIPANATKAISTTATGTLSYPSGFVGAGVAASSNGWDTGTDTKAWVANFATSGYSTIVLSTSRHGSSGTGPRDWKLQYSLNNTSWTNVEGGAYTIPAAVSVSVPETWFSFVDFSLPSAIDNQADVYLRWVVTSTTSVNNALVGTGGTNRIDEVVITGVPLP